MLTAVVTQSGSAITVHLASVPPNSTAEQTITAETVPSDAAVATPLAATAEGSATGATVEVNPGPSPIAPELKEVAWGGGSFVVFAVLMRFVLYPRLKKGMDARYAGIRSSHEGADATRAEAKAEVATALLARGMSVAEVAELTGLPLAEVTKLNDQRATHKRG